MQIHNIATTTTTNNYYAAPHHAIDYPANSIERLRADSVHTTRLLTEHYLERIWAIENERNQLQVERDQAQAERDQLQEERDQFRAERQQLQLLRVQDAERVDRQYNDLRRQLDKERRDREMEKQRLEHRCKVLADSVRKARENATGWMNSNEEMCQEMVGLKQDLRGLKAINQRLIQETNRLTEDRTRVADKYWDKYIGLKTAVQGVVDAVQAGGGTQSENDNSRRQQDVMVHDHGSDSDLTDLSDASDD